MLRSLVRLSGAIALALLLAPVQPSAAPPPGLGYDEIVRVVVGATPPPPGNFQTDVAAAQIVATPTPAPRKRGLAGLANVATAVISGGGAGAIGGAVASDAISSAMDNAMQQSLGAQFGALASAMRGFLQPKLLHYSFWNGWERIDDVAAQTATIRKCDIGSVVTLDLAHKTYAIYTPGSEPVPSAAPAPSRRRSDPAPDPGAPGTMVAQLDVTSRALRALQIEHVPASGYEVTTTFASTQATGSCKNGSASIRMLEYLPALREPSVTSCPMRRPPVPRSADDIVSPSAGTTGGCKPTSAVVHRAGPTPPGGRLSLYTLVSFAASGAPTPAPQPSASAAPASIGFLTERGNLTTLGASNAGLFEIPQGFTKTP